jgi:hypothetical protein
LFYFKLGEENINVDQFLWYERTENFIKAVKEGNFSNTYQQYHPGVTLMYLVGLGQFSYRLLGKDVSSFSDIPYYDFAKYNFHTKFFLVTFCLILIGLSAHLIRKITKSEKISFTFILIIVLESFYVGLIRNLHMDGILSLLLFSTVLSYYLACREKSTRFMLLSAFLLGLGLLTKSASVFGVLFSGIIFFYHFWTNKSKRLWLIKSSFTWVAFSVIIFFLLFPAMWATPVRTLERIINEGVLETGLSGSFDHFIDSHGVDDPGFNFYPRLLLYRTTPVLQLLIVLLVFYIFLMFISKKIKKVDKLIFYTFIFIIIYIAVFISSPKKTDRYMAAVFPFLALLGAFSFDSLWEFFRTRKIEKFFWVFILFPSVIYYFWNSVTLSPYYFAYYNHLWGGINKARYEIYLNQGGIAVFEVADYIESLQLPERPRIAATHETELESVLQYNVSTPDPGKLGEYDVVVVPLQRDRVFKKGMNRTEIIKIQNQNYWKIYTK